MPDSRPNLSSVADAPLYLGMFGKHRAYADHMDDAGMSVPALAAFKRQFYIDGLGACIDRSIWEKEYPRPAALPYDHGLLTVNASGWVMARFVAARDASGRGLYPFVLCIHSDDPSWLHAAPTLWAWLDQRAAAIGYLDDPAHVRAAFAGAREDMREESADWMSRRDVTAAVRRQWAEDPMLSSTVGQGLERVVHALSPEDSGAERVRVSLPGADGAAGALCWASFSAYLLSEPVVTVVWPAGGTCADLTLGPPGSALFEPLFAAPATVTLATNIPFQINEVTRKRVESAVRAWIADPELFPAAASEARGEASAAPTSFLGQAASRLREWWRH